MTGGAKRLIPGSQNKKQIGDEMVKTALEMTPKEWQRYKPFMNKVKILKQQSGTSVSRDDAIKVAKQAAELLRKRFGANKVVLFGSAATNIGFGEFSDIDLAAWGIPRDDYYKAVAAVTGFSNQFKIDLIDPEFCRDSIKKAIEEQGVFL